MGTYARKTRRTRVHYRGKKSLTPCGRGFASGIRHTANPYIYPVTCKECLRVLQSAKDKGTIDDFCFRGDFIHLFPNSRIAIIGNKED